MAIATPQLGKLQKEIKRLRSENTRLKLRMRRSSQNGKKTHRGTAKRVVKLGGLWAGTPEITEQDIADARKEMWGSFGV